MSRFSGKCDLFNTIEIFGADDIINDYKIYICDQILPLEINKPEDIIPYYPYLVTLMVSSQELGGEIRLSARSFVDEEEKEHIGLELQTLLKYWRRCKRKNVPFDSEEALGYIVWPRDDQPQDFQIELVKRVKELGDKTTIDGLHDTIHDMYRKRLFDEMIDHGWSESKSYRWCFGLARWAKWIKENNKFT